MSRADYVAQPALRTTLDALQNIVQDGAVQSVDVAVAYVTSGGVYDLLNKVSKAIGSAWNVVPKRWITSFDYCRTEPVALVGLLQLPNSSVRVHDAQFCLDHGGAPKVPFHPKMFLVRTDLRDYALAGSGNMSRSGLSRGVEAGLVVGVNRTGPTEPSASAVIQSMHAWFAKTWSNATQLTPPLLARYKQLFEHTENLKSPAPTEDDVASTDTGRVALSTKDLQKLRVCRHLWIQAGNISKNLGPNVPGNQLMMKRLSRVFFGFASTDVAKNTHIGDVEIRFKGGSSAPFSLTYSDNKMDKLVLPKPGAGGPPAYDNEYLLFERVVPGVFELIIGTKAAKAQWLKRSAAIDAAFRMASGREWGVF